MPNERRYLRAAVRGWSLLHRPDGWNETAQRKLLEIVEAQPRSRHPQTLPIRLALGGGFEEVYLKVFHSTGAGIWKDTVRGSKARRAWSMGLQLAASGLAAPVTIAAGEQRRVGVLRRAFLVTEKIEGEPLHLFLRAQLRRGPHEWPPAVKRAELRQAAALVRRFHRAGFVHGDLIATNLLVAGRDGGHTLYFMDNDRTRRYPLWLPQRFWKRNLIQLNRMPLPGVTLQDRLRFFKAYREIEKITMAERALARWLERATRRRRAQCDGVDGSGDFRKLMRWTMDAGSPAGAKESG